MCNTYKLIHTGITMPKAHQSKKSQMQSNIHFLRILEQISNSD